ncbi:hypothetical protein KI387_026778, partial [Taxus chinensis]
MVMRKKVKWPVMFLVEIIQRIQLKTRIRQEETRLRQMEMRMRKKEKEVVKEVVLIEDKNEYKDIIEAFLDFIVKDDHDESN